MPRGGGNSIGIGTHIALSVATAVATLLVGCAPASAPAEQEQKTVIRKDEIESKPADVRSHSNKDLRRSGASNAGDALRRLDPRIN